MERDAILTILTDEYAPLAAEANIALTDTPEGVASVLDTAAEVMASLPSDPGPHWHAELARYFLLDRIVKRLAANFNVSESGGSYQLQQVFQNAKVLRDEMYRMVAHLLHASQGGDDTGSRVVEVITPFLTGTDSYLSEF